MTARKARNFTEDELKIIKENSGKISLRELSIQLKYNYTNLSTALKQHKVDFKAKKSVKTRTVYTTSIMMRKKDEKGRSLLTDEHLKEWFKPF
jgi:hypothetical protein